ncbi:hypothetical protein GGI25_005068 [Coemansia spiralis]|uniref:SDE2-like domain-containing protein n=1 Tax=Coemansia spiralis TaxID=417178 RepID=A0A9W8FZ89_9FUNG|nr:hypothetical protein GGI26_006157 [Coemansia sp. RSA 1358]KAJ2672513.1 hypothetical protein GGI25_005068 [Coemansia spiralis]
MLALLDISGCKTLSFTVCDNQPLEDLVLQTSTLLGNATLQNAYFSGRHGTSVADTLANCNSSGILWLTLRGRLAGGKGGFGSTLRSQGSRMASNKPANYDNCRDLYGRRLKTLTETKAIVERLEAEENAREEIKKRRRKKIEEGLREKPAKKHRFDDVEYARNYEEIVEETKKATKRALRAKRKDKQIAVSSGSDKSDDASEAVGGQGLSSKRKFTAFDSNSSTNASPDQVSVIPLFDGNIDDISDSSSNGGGVSDDSETNDSDMEENK